MLDRPTTLDCRVDETHLDEAAESLRRYCEDAGLDEVILTVRLEPFQANAGLSAVLRSQQRERQASRDDDGVWRVFYEGLV